MKERWFAIVAIALALSSCGKSQNSGNSDTASGTAAAPPASSAAPAHPESTAAASAVAAVSRYDSGPRAAASPVDQGAAAKGKMLFTARGCIACHAFGKVLTCPDLVGVPHQRSAEWMTQQILHPDVMVKEDPITMELRTHYKLPMTNQNVKPDEAKELIEYIKSMDKSAN